MLTFMSLVLTALWLFSLGVTVVAALAILTRRARGPLLSFDPYIERALSAFGMGTLFSAVLSLLMYFAFRPHP